MEKTDETTSLVSVAVARPVNRLFTYRVSDENLERVCVGNWVKVPFGKSSSHGFIVGNSDPADLKDFPLEKVKLIQSIGEPARAIPDDVIKLCEWASRYYLAPLGEVLNVAAPTSALGFRSKKEPREIDCISEIPADLNCEVSFTEEQVSSIDYLENLRKKSKSDPQVALIDGVTGSGKTEVYMELARNTLKEGKSVLVLVPEIALTPQLHERFEKALGVTVGLWHSALADGKRRDMWAAVVAGKIRVVVGARSSVFTPLKDLGLIVVDEEHEPTYKQEDRFRYHARDLAVLRGHMTHSLVILGSATPSLETLERVKEGKYGITRLTKRAASGGFPEIDIVDMSEEEWVESTQSQIATRTITEIQETLNRGEQVMIYLNRRGFAAFLLCKDCGWVCECMNCSISMTIHKRDQLLRCHICGFSKPIPFECESCEGKELAPMGAGTESLEDELPTLIENAHVIRLDRDQITSATRLSETLESFRSGEKNILLGTQMLVKGHDFPKVTLVVVVLADHLFRWPDFRASERALQILTQVSGRSGRAKLAGKVLIQTFMPEHPVIQVVTGEVSRDEFLEGERELRQALKYSPFARLARIRVDHRLSKTCQQQSQFLVDHMEKQAKEMKSVEILGPCEAFLERVKGSYRWDILVKAERVQDLQILLKLASHICAEKKWSYLVDVEPIGVG